jgi:acyl-phosphate glycerol 3-phosphate acyltransferase
MTEPAALLLAALLSYLLGAVPFGYLVGRWRGVNIFQEGSGNIGATNVGRVLGRRFGILVFALDFLKGALPTLAAAAVSHSLHLDLPPDALAVTAGVSAFLGHLLPVYLRFRGGKGVATGAGVVAVLLPLLALAAVLTWLVVVSASRYVSLASLAAAAVLCVLRLVLTPSPFSHDHYVLTLFCLWAVALVFVRHEGNLRRLLAGRENRLKDSPAMLSLTKTLHVLAVGLWFGTVGFFLVLGLSLFGTFEKVAADANRPAWFPVAERYDKPRPSEKFPEPLRKEQGTRAAGAAVGPLFGWYFSIQTVCGLVAVMTALSWLRFGRRLHRIRAAVLVLALLTVAGGWALEAKVNQLIGPRDEKTDAVLKQAQPSAEEIQAAEQARASFWMWHGMSMLLNLATVLLVTLAMALAAFLPAPVEAGIRTPSPDKRLEQVAV